MWIICISCHRSVKIKLPKRGAKLRCTSCGSTVAQTVRVLKQTMLNGGPTPADQAKVLTYAGLLSIAANRGYKVGWATMKYRTIFGQWPPEPKPEPVNPGPALMWWIRKQNIEYAKTHFPRDKAKQEKLALESTSELMTEDDWGIEL